MGGLGLRVGVGGLGLRVGVGKLKHEGNLEGAACIPRSNPRTPPPARSKAARCARASTASPTPLLQVIGSETYEGELSLDQLEERLSRLQQPPPPQQPGPAAIQVGRGELVVRL